MFKKLIQHYRQWNRWQKHNENSRFYKIMVLLCLCHSPTFEIMKGRERLSENITNTFEQFTNSLNSAAESFEEFGKSISATLEKGGDTDV